MKKNRYGLFVVGLLCLTAFSLAGCLGTYGGNMSDDFVAREAADSLANPENGLLQETGDLAGLLLDQGAVETMGIEKAAAGVKATVSITVNAQLAAGFVEHSTESDIYYERSWSGSFTTPRYEGQIAGCLVILRFYNQDGALIPATAVTGGGYRVPDGAKSIAYSRTIQGDLTDLLLRRTHTFAINSSLTITGINDGVDGVHLAGSRQAVLDLTSEARDWSGHWEIAFTDINLDADRDMVDGVRITTYDGSADVSFAGTVTGPRGTRSVSASGTVELHGQRTVTIHLDNGSATVDIVTGEVR